MGWYSQGSLAYLYVVTALSLQTFEHLRIFARTSAVTDGTVIFGSASQLFQDVNSLMPFRNQQGNDLALVLVLVMRNELSSNAYHLERQLPEMQGVENPTHLQ